MLARFLRTSDKIYWEGFNSSNSIKWGVSTLYPDRFWYLKLIRIEDYRSIGDSKFIGYLKFYLRSVFGRFSM